MEIPLPSGQSLDKPLDKRPATQSLQIRHDRSQIFGCLYCTISVMNRKDYKTKVYTLLRVINVYTFLKEDDSQRVKTKADKLLKTLLDNDSIADKRYLNITNYSVKTKADVCVLCGVQVRRVYFAPAISNIFAVYNHRIMLIVISFCYHRPVLSTCNVV